jgi:hypothetical protein
MRIHGVCEYTKTCEYEVNKIHSFNLKTVLSKMKNRSSPRKICILGITFCGCTKWGQIYIFEIGCKKTHFWSPIRPMQRKKFSSHRRVNLCFLWTKKPKMQATTQQNVFHTCLDSLRSEYKKLRIRRTLILSPYSANADDYINSQMTVSVRWLCQTSLSFGKMQFLTKGYCVFTT